MTTMKLSELMDALKQIETVAGAGAETSVERVDLEVSVRLHYGTTDSYGYYVSNRPPERAHEFIVAVQNAPRDAEPPMNGLAQGAKP